MVKTSDDGPSAASEWSEIRLVASGDQSAFARLMDRESPRLLRLAFGSLGGVEEAEDVVQETFIALWENAGSLRPEARIRTWLHTVCYNKCVDRVRRSRSFSDPSALNELPDPSEAAEITLIRGDAVESVREAVGRLPERQRMAVLLFHLQDLPQSEAARVMGTSEDAFESLLARARRQLRAWLSAVAR